SCPRDSSACDRRLQGDRMARASAIPTSLSMIPAIVLAAGRSARMGRPKALLPLENGETFVSRIVRTFRDAEVDDIVVVVGHEPEGIVAELETTGVSVRFAMNPDFDAGQLTSLVAGLRLVDRPGVVATLVTLVD